MADVDESDFSEITILPDGRVYAFGVTLGITEILNSLQSRECALRHQEKLDSIVAVEVHARKETN